MFDISSIFTLFLSIIETRLAVEICVFVYTLSSPTCRVVSGVNSILGLSAEIIFPFDKLAHPLLLLLSVFGLLKSNSVLGYL